MFDVWNNSGSPRVYLPEPGFHFKSLPFPCPWSLGLKIISSSERQTIKRDRLNFDWDSDSTDRKMKFCGKRSREIVIKYSCKSWDWEWGGWGEEIVLTWVSGTELGPLTLAKRSQTNHLTMAWDGMEWIELRSRSSHKKVWAHTRFTLFPNAKRRSRISGEDMDGPEPFLPKQAEAEPF